MNFVMTIIFDGLITAGYLFIVACGLTIVFGVMKILNVAHGGFYACGAYLAAYGISMAARVGLPDWAGFLIIPIAAVLVGLVLGWSMERGVLRFLYGRSEVSVLLASFAIFLIIEDLIQIIFGFETYYAFQPMLFLGTVQIGDIPRNIYSLTLPVVAGMVAVGCWYAFRFTRPGKLIVAVIFDREMSETVGINVRSVFVSTFIIGAMLGAFGGAYVAPLTAVTPGLGVEIIAMSFAVVAIGGMGSIPGATIGALAVGMVRALCVHLFPAAELFAIYGLMVLCLTVRPEGIFTPVKVRRI